MSTEYEKHIANAERLERLAEVYAQDARGRARRRDQLEWDGKYSSCVVVHPKASVDASN